MTSEETGLLPGFEPSEQDLIDAALAAPLEVKIQRAIALLKHYEQKALELSPEEGFYLAFSGGKDSQAVHLLATLAGVKFQPYFNDTTIDPPELKKFIKEHYPETIWQRRPHCFFTMLKRNGLPFRNARWCCSYFKEQGGKGKFKVVGVRISESKRRAKLWREFAVKMGGQLYLAPIAYWTEEDVWNFLNAHNMPHCELYDQGFKRLGCIGCALAGTKDRLRQFKRWPQFERAYKMCAKVYHAKRSQYEGRLKNQPFELYWNHWLYGTDENEAQCSFLEQFDEG